MEEETETQKGGANAKPEPRSSDSKSIVLANTACCPNFRCDVSMQLHHPVRR